jgi:hypothetical protein
LGTFFTDKKNHTPPPKSKMVVPEAKIEKIVIIGVFFQERQE